MWVTSCLPLLAGLGFANTSMPQLTAQYGQIVRAARVLPTLKGRTCAASCASALLKPNAAIADPAAPAPANFIKWRRETSMFMGWGFLLGRPSTRREFLGEHCDASTAAD